MTFDPVSTGLILESIYQLEESDSYLPYNNRFNFLGYESSNFIHLIGTPILIMKIYGILCLFYLFLSYFKS